MTSLLIHPVLVSARDANTLATTPYNNNPQLLRCVQQQVQLGYNHNCAVNCFFHGGLAFGLSYDETFV